MCRLLLTMTTSTLRCVHPQISKILSGLPPPSRRQTYLFSATFPRDVEDLANVAMKRQHV